MPDKKPNDIDIELLVRMVIHDLDAPLAVINNMLNRIRIGRFDPKNDSHLRLVRSSNMALDRAQRMMRDLQEVMANRSLNVKMKKIDIRMIGENIVSEFQPVASSEGYRFEWSCKKRGDINTDPDIVARIAMNFLFNALYHSNRTKPINLLLERLNDDAFKISVRNYGSKIPDEFINKIFNPGVQLNLKVNRKYQGHGLGLAFCKIGAEAIGGVVKASNLSDETVEFSLIVNGSNNNE